MRRKNQTRVRDNKNEVPMGHSRGTVDLPTSRDLITLDLYNDDNNNGVLTTTTSVRNDKYKCIRVRKAIANPVRRTKD